MSELDDMLTLVRVVERGGLSRAAGSLGVSKSVVSRRLDRLERELDVKLLQRTTRGVSLTDAGRVFEARCVRILADLQDARDEVAGSDGHLTGMLRLAAPMSFGWRHLASPLAAFAVRHERLVLDVSYADRAVDLIGEGFDAAVRLGALADSRLVARRLAPVRRQVVASPAYLLKHGEPTTPADLASHACLQATQNVAGDDWRFRVGQRWLSASLGMSRFRADNGEALLEGALAGLGLAMLPTFISGDAIGRGELVPVLKHYPLSERSLFILRPPGAASAKVRALSDFLAERFGPEPYWDPCQGPDR